MRWCEVDEGKIGGHRRCPVCENQCARTPCEESESVERVGEGGKGTSLVVASELQKLAALRRKHHEI